MLFLDDAPPKLGISFLPPILEQYDPATKLVKSFPLAMDVVRALGRVKRGRKKTHAQCQK